ncbi:integrase catalytic domain-containing protein [Nephila pilipes]|uniref:Integrase catalytic domain-containing protein n=1 Tax=Nephila pilipes TaxID=299642 RepID=A0A8X6Q8R8_NEPPI|nr:integrase catalytic domain-containing protein [Nephila pilipes]
MATDENINKLQRKRSTLCSKVTRLTGKLNDADGIDKAFDVELLEDTLKDLKLMNETIHDLLNDEDYERDTVGCEKYFDTAKLAIFNTKRKVSANINVSSSEFSPPSSINTSVKLPTIKINTFFGGIEEFPSFWQRFNSCIDSNASLSLVDKHVFLRGYLDGEAKRLVDGISVIGDTYETTKKLLEDKYGTKDRIIQSHLDYLENLKPVQDPSPMELNYLYIDCNRRLQALNALGENTEAYGRILAPKIIRAFPTEICCRWIIYAKREKLAEGNITRLMQFLAEEVEGSVEAQKIRGTLFSDNILKSSVENFNIDLKLVNTNKKISPFCNTSGYWPQNCETVTDYKTRVQKLKSSNRCFLCTNRGHRIANCPRKSTARCIKCKKQHHFSICPPRNTQLLITNSEVNHINISRTNFTHLQTACLYVTGPTGITKLTRCILDGGSQASFVDVKLIDKLKLNVINSSSLRVQAFEFSFTQEQRRCVQLTLSGLWSKQSILITAFESNNSYTTHSAATLEISQFAHKNKLKLADPPDNSSLPIELLIGGDYYWQIVTAESPIKLSDSFVMVPSMLGWILSGSRTHTTIADDTFVHQFSMQISNDCLNDQVRCFWELDSIGIQDIQKRRMSAREEEILSKFHKDYETEDNRRIVSLT